MKKQTLLFTCLLFCLYGEEPAIPEKKGAPIATMEGNKEALLIEAKLRSADYVFAFDLLKKEKPSTKIQLRLTSGTTIIPNELTATPNGSILLAKIGTNSGFKYQVVPVEQVVEMSYAPN